MWGNLEAQSTEQMNYTDLFKLWFCHLIVTKHQHPSIWKGYDDSLTGQL